MSAYIELCTWVAANSIFNQNVAIKLSKENLQKNINISRQH
jgi:hypothetical protein